MKKKFKSAALHTAPENHVSSLIEKALHKHKITLPELARLIGVGVMTMRDWQSGKSAPKFPVIFTLDAVTKADSIEW